MDFSGVLKCSHEMKTPMETKARERERETFYHKSENSSRLYIRIEISVSTCVARPKSSSH